MNLSLDTLVDQHLAAYSEPDGARRSALVARLWAGDGRLVDPPLESAGHAAISAQAEALLAQFPAHRFERSTAVDAHHGFARYGWRLVDGQGTPVLEGCDFAQVGDDGALRLVVGFFGALPTRDNGAPCG